MDDTYPPILDLNSNEYVTDTSTKVNYFNSFFLSHNKIDTTRVALPPSTNTVYREILQYLF